jgi:hypothetical protein
MTAEEMESQRLNSLMTLKNPQTQRERNNHNRELGKKGESLISSSLKRNGFWRLKQINLGDGTKCDFIAAHRDYGAFMLEVKTTDSDVPTIAYSWITENERKALTEFEGLIGRGHAFVVGLWLRSEAKRAFLIPWYTVSEAICSGCRGSIAMMDFPELPRVSGGWDMSCFGRKE